MKRYVDLSGLVENGLWSYRVQPGLEGIIPPASIETIATVKRNDSFASRISLSSITGTYLESGAHILEGRRPSRKPDPRQRLTRALPCQMLQT